MRERVAARLASVERVVAVTSGKGGVGKSAIAVNLAVALAGRGARVGLLDADLQGPSVAKMLGLRGQPLRVSAAGELRPIAGPQGLRVQSMDFFLQGNRPLAWDGEAGEGTTLRSALEQAALGDLLAQTGWGELEHLVVDLAPGGDRLLALRQLWPAVLALGVTIPTEVALLAVDRSLQRAREARIPLIGLVENMASAVCPHCGRASPLFREAPVAELARALDVEVLASIPFDPALAAAADAGSAFLLGPGADSPAGVELLRLAERVASYRPPGPEGESW